MKKKHLIGFVCTVRAAMEGRSKPLASKQATIVRFLPGQNNTLIGAQKTFAAVFADTNATLQCVVRGADCAECSDLEGHTVQLDILGVIKDGLLVRVSGDSPLAVPGVKISAEATDQGGANKRKRPHFRSLLEKSA